MRDNLVSDYAEGRMHGPRDVDKATRTKVSHLSHPKRQHRKVKADIGPACAQRDQHQRWDRPGSMLSLICGSGRCSQSSIRPRMRVLLAKVDIKKYCPSQSIHKTNRC